MTSMKARRYEFTDKEWELVQPLIPISHTGRPQKDIRAHLKGIMWLARSGARWSDLPARFGPHQTLAGRWDPEKGLRALRDLEHWRGAEHGFNVDQSIRAGRSWNKKESKSQTSSSIGKTRGGLNTKIHAIVGKDLRPVAFLLSAGNVDDCTEAVPLLKLLSDLKDCDILADKAYGTKEIRTYLHEQSARYTIPPKVNTKQPWPFDKETYKRRNVIERFFNRLKEFRRAETRYDKRDDLFLAFVMVAAICVAFGILHS